MRSPFLQSLMLRLALAAALLLVFAPTVSRLLSTASGSGWTEMCTVTGLKLVKLPASSVDPGPAQPSGDMPRDCAYCALLNSLAILLCCALLALASSAARQFPSCSRIAPRYGILPGGHGSRGPPWLAA
jgi:hypothetical protein